MKCTKQSNRGISVESQSYMRGRNVEIAWMMEAAYATLILGEKL